MTREELLDTIAPIVILDEGALDAILDAVEQAIREKFTPSLNTGTALDALILVGGVLRELRGRE